MHTWVFVAERFQKTSQGNFPSRVRHTLVNICLEKILNHCLVIQKVSFIVGIEMK